MADRTVLLSSHANGVVEGLDEVLNSDEYLSRLARINTPVHCLRLLSLCGARRFQIAGFDRAFRNANVASTRLGWKPYDSREWSIQNVVTSTFDHYLPFGWQFKEGYAPVNTLVAFLEDLLVASRRKVSVVALLPVPSRSELEGLVPAELLGPLSVVLDRVERVEMRGPMALSKILARDTRDLQALFESPEFGLLCERHQAAESTQSKLGGLVSLINDAARRVADRFEDVIEIRSLAVGTLTTTADLVGASFGRIAGTLAEAGAGALSSLIRGERRVLIYELTPELDTLVAERRADYERAGGN